MHTEAKIHTRTVNTTRVIVGTMLGAVGMSAAMGMLMGYEYASNGNQFFPDEAFDRFIAPEIVEQIDEPEYRTLDGLNVSEELKKGVAVALPIDNSVSGRANQMGTENASIMYEFLVEGEITRFTSVFEGINELYSIGPIRSLRIPIVQWLHPMYGTLIHAGGSPQSLAEVVAQGVINIDQTDGDEGYFWRDGSKEAPHNLYTNAELIAYGLRDKGALFTDDQVEEWNFRRDDQVGIAISGEGVREVDVHFSTEEYRASFVYNPVMQTYERLTAGEVHFDQNTGNQLAPKNVVLQYVEEPEVNEDGVRQYNLFGEGRMQFFSQGVMQEGRWIKEEAGARTQFVDEEGNSLYFLPGQTWISIVNPDMEVSIK